MISKQVRRQSKLLNEQQDSNSNSNNNKTNSGQLCIPSTVTVPQLSLRATPPLPDTATAAANSGQQQTRRMPYGECCAEPHAVVGDAVGVDALDSGCVRGAMSPTGAASPEIDESAESESNVMLYAVPSIFARDIAMADAMMGVSGFVSAFVVVVGRITTGRRPRRAHDGIVSSAKSVKRDFKKGHS